MSAPDRIWTTGRDDTGSWNASETRIDIPERVFLASTPAREHAEEMQALLLDLMADQKSRFGNNTIYPRLTAILSKIDTGENNDQG